MCEYDEVRNKAAKAGETVHFGRVFPIVVEKGSELPPEQRRYKGRVVFQGNNVKDQDNHAVFNELASSASLMVAGKFLDVIGSLEGCGQEQSDAEQAYTQALLKGHTTWIFLPRDQWPDSWKSSTILYADYDLRYMGTHCLVHSGRSTPMKNSGRWASSAFPSGSRVVFIGD